MSENAKRDLRPVTARQGECARIILNYFEENGYWPSYKYIATTMGGIGKNAVFGHINALAAKGILESVPNTARAYRLLPLHHTILGVKGSTDGEIVSARGHGQGPGAPGLAGAGDVGPGDVEGRKGKADSGRGSVRKKR